MNKRTAVIVIAVIITVIGGSIFTSLKVKSLTGFTVKKDSTQVKDGHFQKSSDEAGFLFEEAGNFIKKAKPLDARRAYKKLLTEYPESPLVKTARSKLDELNMSILFSPVQTEDSMIYEVKTGDTLGKIAKELGTTIELIMKSNNLTSTLIRPKMRLKISKAKYSILVDKSQNTLILKAGGEVLKTYVVSTGSDNGTPAGVYSVKNKLVNPTWFKTGAIVPPDSPENILGTRWIGLTISGYGIHGTTDESTIGMQITAGCVRMKNRDVEELYSIIPIGTEVTIID